MSQVGGVQVRVSGSGVKWRGDIHQDITQTRQDTNISSYVCMYVITKREEKEKRRK